MPDKISVEERRFEEPKLKFEEPKLKFEEPEVKEAGDLTKVTKGFFGPFSP